MLCLWGSLRTLIARKWFFDRSCVCMISIWLVVCKFTFCDILIIKIEDSKIQIMNFLFCGAKFINSMIVKKQKICFNTCFDSSESFSIECEVSCCCLSFCSFSIFLGRFLPYWVFCYSIHILFFLVHMFLSFYFDDW